MRQNSQNMPAMKKSWDWFSDHLEPPVEETIYSLYICIELTGSHASYET